MNRTRSHVGRFHTPGQRRTTGGKSPRRVPIVCAATLVIFSITLASPAPADTTYSGTLDATLKVAGFMDANGNPISQPAGLTLSNTFAFFDDSFVIIEGDATADANGAIDVIAGDPFNMVAGDRFDMKVAVAGTTVYPTGFSQAQASGAAEILVANASPDLVTVSFDFVYNYALTTSVGVPALEEAFALVQYNVSSGMGSVVDLFAEIGSNDSLADMEAGTFEITLPSGQSESVAAFGGVPGGGAIPEPASWLLGALLLWGRRSRCSLIRTFGE